MSAPINNKSEPPSSDSSATPPFAIFFLFIAVIAGLGLILKQYFKKKPIKLPESEPDTIIPSKEESKEEPKQETLEEKERAEIEKRFGDV